ncbi:MAG: hypothetical protein U0575_01180 [Phycisphaerales bacterium]
MSDDLKMPEIAPPSARCNARVNAIPSGAVEPSSAASEPSHVPARASAAAETPFAASDLPASDLPASDLPVSVLPASDFVAPSRRAASSAFAALPGGVASAGFAAAASFRLRSRSFAFFTRSSRTLRASSENRDITETFVTRVVSPVSKSWM